MEEIASLFHVHRNTVREWVKRGLPTCDDRRPMLILGPELAAFLQARRLKNRQTCSPGEIYCVNPAVQTKLGLMGIAGLNVLFFYRFVFGAVKTAGADAEAPRAARVMAAVSLTCWVGVIVCGRLITYFRPPYHWCFWC